MSRLWENGFVSHLDIRQSQEDLQRKKPEAAPEAILEAEPPVEQVVEKPLPKKKAPAEKPPLSQKAVEKPLKQKKVIERTPEPEPYVPAFQPVSWYEQMVHMRNQQAMARNEAMMAPYQALVAARGARNHLHYQR